MAAGEAPSAFVGSKVQTHRIWLVLTAMGVVRRKVSVNEVCNLNYDFVEARTHWRYVFGELSQLPEREIFTKVCDGWIVVFDEFSVVYWLLSVLVTNRAVCD